MTPMVPAGTAGEVRSAVATAGPSGPAGTRPTGGAGTRPPGERPEGPVTRLEGLVRGFLTLFLEVEAGRRPRRHLAAVMTPLLYARLTAVRPRPGPVASVRSVRLMARTGARCDLVALVRRGPRCTAVAVALTRDRRRGWLVEEIASPEAGPLPPPPYPVPCDHPDDDDDGDLPPEVAGADWFDRHPPG